MVEGAQIGAYQLVRKIGSGGMGDVWLAHHALLGRRAAIKLLHPMFSSQPDIVQRFFNEARAATSIDDPGIVQIFDFGQHTDGTAYLVMELLDGQTLETRVANQHMSMLDALRILRQVAGSLGAAHACGIVHRDIKPENIFLVRDPEVPGGERAKILDFGIAKLAGPNAHSKTNTSAMMGTPTYMSPEQCRGAGQVDQRSDIYSLGCVLFYMLVGRPPFEDAGIGEIIAMHLREAPPPPSTRAFGISPAVDQLVLRCLAKDPAQRFPSGGALAAEIAALIESGAATVATTRTEPARTTTPAMPAQQTTLSTASGAAVEPAPKRRRTVAVAGVAAGLLGGAIVLATHRSPEPATKPDPVAKLEPAAVAKVEPAPVATKPEPAKVVVPEPAPVVPPKAEPTPTPEQAVTARMTAVVTSFTSWKGTHAGAPCPDIRSLDAELDPWDHAMTITCTKQPADQIIGVISAGPDGRPGTADDVVSWRLPDVARLATGKPWTAAKVAVGGKAPRGEPPVVQAKESPTSGIADPFADTKSAHPPAKPPVEPHAPVKPPAEPPPPAKPSTDIGIPDHP